MEVPKLAAKTRKIKKKKVQALRDKNFIPAVIYGQGIKNQSLEVEYLPFEKIYGEAGESSLIDLSIDEAKPVKVLIQDVQKDHLSDKVTHIDFHQMKMTQKITADIKIEFVGEAPGVKEQGGILVKNVDELEVKCLPQDLVHEIKVDLAVLKNIDDIIYIKDLEIPENVEVLSSPDDPVVSITQPREEEEKPVETEEGGEVEGEEAEIKEGESASAEASASAKATADKTADKEAETSNEKSKKEK